MSTVGSHVPGLPARHKFHPRIIIARGDHVRSFTLRPWLAGITLLIGFVFGTAYLLATGYLIFRDDLLAASITRQGRMQTAYEDRIAALRADIDRLTSRQLLNQDAFDAKLERLLGKQAALDARQDIIASLSQTARRAGIAPSPATAPVPPPDDTTADVPADENGPASDDVAPQFGPAKTSDITGSTAPAPKTSSINVALLRTGTDPLPASDTATRMESVETSLTALARDQVAYVESVADKVAERTDKIAAILEKLGQDVPASRGGAGSDDVGGPFIPLADNADPETFRSGVDLISTEIDRFMQIRRIAAQLPLGRPLPGAVITSGFGARIDPFFGRPAIHPGIDFRAPVGFPVRATAGGTVITAGYSGGYGNMVEIDHGNGVTTRYGHMSAILVSVGQIVNEGALLGRAGSTGRSTGPHLHYEVRLDGNAIDPMRYIKAGRELAPLL